MFRSFYNQAILRGYLAPRDPLLIAEGGVPSDPVAPNLSFIRTELCGEPSVYLPGSSLKGVLRAHAESILRTRIGLEAAEDPFDHAARRLAAAAARKENGNTPEAYIRSCDADRIFGSTTIAGRFRVGDAHPTAGEDREAANRTEIRYGVALDRDKQSVKHGPFEQEVVVEGRFAFKAILENFELWMLSLILQSFFDLNEGLVQIGHGKSRGFGTMRWLDPVLEILWPGNAPPRLEGAGAREPLEDQRLAYGLSESDCVPLPEGFERVGSGLLQGYLYRGETAVESVLEICSYSPWRELEDRAGGSHHGA